jgi:putative hydrolase of the HAD superfamily
MAIRGVIFDYGMVLSNPQDPVVHQRLIEVSGLSREVFEQHYWRYRHAYDLGEFNGVTYWQRIAADTASSYSPEQIEQLIENDVLMWTSLNEEMLGWVTALQEAGFKTAILSNMGPEILRYMRQEFGWLSHFNHHTWSCELGIAKPDPAIYIHTCEKLGVAPEEAIFLDDKAENIAAAAGVGLNAIQFDSIGQLRRDLEARGLQSGLPVPGEFAASEAHSAQRRE